MKITYLCKYLIFIKITVNNSKERQKKKILDYRHINMSIFSFIIYLNRENFVVKIQLYASKRTFNLYYS